MDFVSSNTGIDPTTLADSGVARNDLVRMVAYPDSTPGWSSLGPDDWANLTPDQWANLGLDPTGDVTQQTYNRLGEVATFKEQRGRIKGVISLSFRFAS